LTNIYGDNPFFRRKFYGIVNKIDQHLLYFAGIRASLRASIFETPVVLLINEQGEKEKGRDEREFSWCLVF
jgi:hypothetical protein